MELKIQLRRLEIEADIKRLEIEREREREEREHRFDLEEKRLQSEREERIQERQKAREHELALKQLELNAQQAIPPREQTPAFRVESAVKLIPKFNEHDIETFLLTFEKIAELNKFPCDKYAAVLQAHLTGKALKVFTELSVADCQDYSKLKAALLTAYAVVPEVYRKRFRGVGKSHSETYSEFAFRLSTHFKRWLESEQAFDNIERLHEIFQMEQFTSVLETDVRLWLLDQKPKTLVEAARLADQYLAVHKASHVVQKSSHWKSNATNGRKWTQHASTTTMHNDKEDRNKGNVESRPTSHSTFTKTPKVICYFCKKPGHTLATCQKRLARLTGGDTNENTSVHLVSTMSTSKQDALQTTLSQKDNTIDPRFEQHCVITTITRPDETKMDVKGLRDTGALQSLVSSHVLTDNDYQLTGEYRLIRGVTGDTLSVPLIEVTLSCSLCSGTFLCGLVQTLPPGIALLIGNDLCPEEPIKDVSVVTRSQARKQKQVELETVANKTDDQQVSPSNLDKSVTLGGTSDKLDCPNLRTNVSDTSDTLSQSFENVNREELIQLQKSDPDLSGLFDLVDKPGHDYTLQSGVLVRLWRDKLSPAEATIHQIVVPKPLRGKLLHIAHDIPAAGHLGVAKTKNRLLRHFYWPRISRDTKDYCRSCDTCQRLGKGPSCAPAPLHSIPLVTEPFCQIAIDIVGPLPTCKETGNRFILTVLDLCTHYPEAIPLKQHTAQDVAQALGNVFCRFGFPQEILSDQASEFVSELMQIFLHEFGISHVRASAYHPQSNGACERFNGTLKTMMRSLTEKFPDSWDEALPWILFAYREVPVETLGYSPFDLLFGRSVAGPLSLLKSSWLQETNLDSAKQNVVEFVLKTREQLRHALQAAHEYTGDSRNKSKQRFDRRAVLRTFETGDKVLVLLPIPGKPLHAKYVGPYVIQQKLGPVDYVVSTPDRRKTKRVCHVNLLKKYHERDPRFISEDNTNHTDILLGTTASETPDSEPTSSHSQTKLSASLTAQQKSDLYLILSEFDNIFSEIPGKTHIGVHHISLQPNSTPIRSPPYRLNPEKAKILKEQLTELLNLGIIEESESAWASPIVMVPKADGTLRLCTDFRKVNNISVPDPFPLPRVEDLLDRVGKARYLTKLDMTRGYWQVPLDEESVPVSAFVTPFGHFQWRYMPFGLRNAPATFSRIVTKLLSGLECFCAAYLDDIIIFSNNWEEHLKHLRIVFSRIHKANLTLNKTKCQFAAAEVDYLGHHVGLGSVQPRTKKVEALLSFPRPENRKQLQAFLGLAGYYRKFVPHFAHLSAILSDLLKKNVRFEWTPERDKAFLDVKSRLATQPILRPPDYALPFCLAVDASDIAIGAALFQVIDGIEHPVCYYSKKLDVHQKNYSTVEKEALALIHCVRTFSVYFGSTVVKVYTDHSPLQFVQKMANHNQKLLRWSLELQQFNLEICHRAGKDNLLPDLLSRPNIG